MAIKDLGPVTAYAYAVQGGYTGTEQEFTEALGQAGITLAELEGLRAVATTLAEGQQATASYANGVLTLGIPRGATGSTGAKGDKGDTGETGNGIESIVLTSTVGSVKTYTITFTDGTTTTFEVKDGEVTEESLEETLEDYAKNNGYYDEFTAGSAEQLLSSQFVEDSVPYKFRTSGGSKDIGNREYDEIVGGSIVWNQLQIRQELNSPSRDGLTFTTENDYVKVVGTPTKDINDLYFRAQGYQLDSARAGHIFLLQGIPSDGGRNKYFQEPLRGSGASYFDPTYPQDTGKGTVFKAVNNSGNPDTIYGIRIVFKKDVSVDGKFRCQLFDLTQMFGSTVADYIYQLEQAQSGKGVAFFKSLFPNDYYPYNAGELMSVEGLQSHDTVGFNQWDEETESGTLDSSTGAEASNNGLRAKNYTRCVPNTSYHFTNTGTDVFCILCFYDASKNFISSLTNIHQGSNFTTPNNAQYFRFAIAPAYGTTYKNDICINLSWSGWRNGEYEPYKKHSYPLDSSLTLRGILKLNAQNELYFDGDIYSHDGKADRRLAEVDMGSLNWSRTASYTRGVFYVNLTGAKTNSYNTDSNLLNVKYTATTRKNASELATAGDKLICLNGGTNQLLVTDDSYTTASDFKTAMSGVMLIYELATPTEETAEPYTSPQAVDDFGTEEYISGNVVPVGHNTQYPANLRDKLQHLPNLADNNGAYLIRQTNKQMSLEVFRIPKAPTTDGTYTLKATVSGGTPTYVWESEETE